MMDIKAVCFDIDGTMYPKWMTHLFLVPTLFGSPSLMRSIQKFRAYMRSGGDIQVTPPTQEGFRMKQAEFVLKQLNRDPDASEIEMMERRIEKSFYRKMEKPFTRIVAYRGLEKTLDFLCKRGIWIGALSDFPIEEKLKTLKVAHLIDFAECTEVSGFLKPHRAPFEYLVKMANCPPHQILYVGDSYRKDIVGAHEAGMRTALLLPHSRGKKKEKYPLSDILFSDYDQFKRTLDTLIT
ncbi:MAG: HAD family hydrolase [Sphaerochaetaceae bacterium]|nr:HAD family hydrolase [Sphaerochaetaceae bacterium]